MPAAIEVGEDVTIVVPNESIRRAGQVQSVRMGSSGVLLVRVRYIDATGRDTWREGTAEALSLHRGAAAAPRVMRQSSLIVPARRGW